jgi:hypothetical protein
MPPDVSALGGNGRQDRALGLALRGTNGREPLLPGQRTIRQG